MTTFQIRYEETDNTTNKQNHAGVSLADTEAVLHDEGALRFQDREDDRQPWIIMGMDATRRLLVAAYTQAESGIVHVIGARIASNQETRQYLEN